MASSSSSSTSMTSPSNGSTILLKDRDSLQLSWTTSSTNGNGSSGPNMLYKEKGREREKSYSVLSRGRRPSPPPRLPSYSKRHASFDSPREVPMPSPSLSTLSGHHGHSQSQSHVEFSYFDAVVPPRSPKSPRKMTSSFIKEKERDTTVFEEEPSEETHLYDTNGILPAASQIHPYPRPYSLPHSSSTDGCGAGANARRRAMGGAEAIPGLENSMSNLNMNRVDRSSSASLPLPAQIPFHTLPRVGDPHKTDVGRLRGVRGNGLSDVAKSRVLETEVDDADDGDGRTSRSSASGSGSSEGTLPSGSPSPPIAQLKADPPLFRSPPSMNATSNPNVPNIHAAYLNHTSSSHSSSATNYSRPLSSTLQSRQAALVEATAHATALRRRPSANTNPSLMASSYPPPEPPMILPPPSPPPVALNLSSPQSQNLDSVLQSATSPPVVVPRITNASDLPPVLPPTSRTSIHSTSSTAGALGAPSPSTGLLRSPSNSSNSGMATSNINTPPAYAPFLSHMPPPADSWIEVETTPGEYRLNIRLPGFKRDGITLATKRRRILHVVADSWPDPDPNSRVNSTSSTPATTPAANANLSTADGSSSSATSTASNASSTHAAISLNPPPTPTPYPGGHFERRISFGYDADLVGVRAEFDGEMLRIVVPRRQGFGTGGTGVGISG